MSVSNDFSALVSNLQIDNQSTISTRYKAITKRLNIDFWDTVSETSHSWYVGSVGRGTAIKGVSDIDMIMQLPGKLYETYNNYTSNGQSALLQEVKNSIKKTYSTTDLGGDGQVVVVNFVDMKFEVVPCFSTVEGDFIYPDSNNGGSWKRMNPLAEIAAIRDADNDYNNNVRRLAKMMRAWKEKCNVQMRK
jgi:tRNA nucleotidyltransferase (CCA-adding enzyme)